MPAQKHGHRLFGRMPDSAFVLWPAERFLCRKVLQKLAFPQKESLSGCFRFPWLMQLPYMPSGRCAARKTPLWITISGFKYGRYWIIRFWFSYLRGSDFERWTENELADGRGKLVSVGLEQGVKLFVLLRLPSAVSLIWIIAMLDDFVKCMVKDDYYKQGVDKLSNTQ